MWGTKEVKVQESWGPSLQELRGSERTNIKHLLNSLIDNGKRTDGGRGSEGRGQRVEKSVIGNAELGFA